MRMHVANAVLSSMACCSLGQLNVRHKAILVVKSDWMNSSQVFLLLFGGNMHPFDQWLHACSYCIDIGKA